MIFNIYNIGVDLYNGFNGLRHRINWTYFTVLDGLAHPLYSNTLLKALRKYWIIYTPDKDGYLFPSVYSGSKNPYLNENYINRLFRKHIKQFSFYVPSMRYHNLRDTYATLMLKNGCNIFTLKKLLGHSSFSSTSRYIKCDISDLAQAPVLSSLMEIE